MLLLSSPPRFMNVNIFSSSFSAKFLSSSFTDFKILDSTSEPEYFRICAAVLTPPNVAELVPDLFKNCSLKTSSRCDIALGLTASRDETRAITSARMSSLRNLSNSPAVSCSNTESTTAMT